MAAVATSQGTSRVVVGDGSMTGRSTLEAYAPIAVAVGLLALAPVFFGESRTYMGLAVEALAFAGYAVGFNLIFGMTGQLFLSVGALAGVAGYATAILADRAGLPVGLTVVLGTAMSALLGATFSWVAVRRSLDVIFAGIVTLTFSLAFANLLLGQRELTGGETGLVVRAGGDTVLGEHVSAFYVFLAVLAAFLVLFRWLQRSFFGWAFRALRDDEMTAELAGVDVARFRIWAGFIGSAMIGLTGSLYALHQGFISPSTYAFGHVDVRTLVLLAFGGIGTMLGPVVGAVSFELIDEFLRDVGRLRVAVYGAILTALFLGFRGGVVPAAAALYRRLRRRSA